MFGQATYRSRIISTVALLILFTGYCMTLDLPERCRLPKPKSQVKQLNCEETGKDTRWFLHSEKGCKRSGYCDPQDTDMYDPMTQNNGNINYFLSEAECVETCMTSSLTCPTLEAIPNGTVSNNGSGYWGTSVKYTCNKGYGLVGESVRTCKRTENNEAAWTGTAPICREKCPPPSFSEKPLFDISPKTLQEFYNHEDAIHYTCKPGYMGNSTRRVCMEDGTWSNGEPTCKPIKVECPEPERVNHANVNAPKRTVGSVLTYQCKDGFLINGNSSRECTESGEWSGEKPFCWKFSIYMCDVQSCTKNVTNQTVELKASQGRVRFLATLKYDQETVGQNPFPDMELRWDPELNTIPEVDINGEELSISVLKTHESGTQDRKYTVTFGQYQVYFNLNIVQSPENNGQPKALLLTPMKQTTSLDAEAELTCLFQGTPSPDVIWYHNNQAVHKTSRISIQTESISTSFTLSTITINPVQEEDLGSYKCKGLNTAGTNFSKEGEVMIDESSSHSSSLSSSRPLSKRSLDTEDGFSLCNSKAPSDTVTIVARVKRSPDLNVPGLTMYRMKIDRVISPSSEPIESRHIRTIVMHDSETSDKLSRNGLYILQGSLHENMLVVEQRDSILNHSLELEHSLRHC